MKTRISQVAVALFFALIVIGNVNANEHKLDASSHEMNQETSLEFENWMTDKAVWNTHSDYMFGEAFKADLEVEYWMTSEVVWEVESSNLEIENWMLDKDIWEVENDLSFITDQDQELEVENWMMNADIW